MAIEVVKIREFIGHTQAVYGFSMCENSAHVYSGGGDGFLVKWQMHQKDGYLLAKLPSAIYEVYCCEGQVYAGTRQGVLFAFDAAGYKFKEVQVTSSSIYRIKKTGDFLTVLCGDGCLYLYDINLNFLSRVQISPKSLRTIAQYGESYLVAGGEGVVYQLDNNLQLVGVLFREKDTLFDLIADQDKHIIVTGSKDARIKFYRHALVDQVVDAHVLHVHSLALHPEKKTFLSSSMDKSIRLWDIENRNLLKVINFEKNEAHRSSVNKILWFDKNNFISCSDDRTLMCFEIQHIT